MPHKATILTVCTGNVCRSPLAEQLLTSHLRTIPGVTVHSAGTHALVGEPMPAKTREIARQYGIRNVAAHRARQLNEDLLESSDLILTMTREQRREVVELNPRTIRRVFTIREFARLAEVTSDEVLCSELQSAGARTAERLRAVADVVKLSRHILPPLDDPAEDDVIDPYRRDDDVHRLSARQLAPAVDGVAELLRRSLVRVH